MSGTKAMKWQGVVVAALLVVAMVPAGAQAQTEPAVETQPAEDVEPPPPLPDVEADEPTEEPAEEAGTDEKKEGVVILKKSTPGKKMRGPYSVLGAATLEREDTAVRVAVGFPEFQAMYHMPWDTDLEFGVGAGFTYGFNAMTAGDFSGGLFMGEARWRFYREGEHSLALVAQPSLVMGAGGVTDFAMGLNIGFPGLVYDYEIKGDNHAIMGFSIPWGLYAGEAGGEAGFSARIPFVFKMGMEFALSSAVHVFATAETGVDVWLGDAPLPEGDGAYLYARMLAGAAFLL